MNHAVTEIISFQGGDGSSIYNAIEIVGAQSFSSGIQAEFEFINATCNENDVESAEGKIIFFPDAVIHHVNIVTKKGEIKNISSRKKINDKRLSKNHSCCAHVWLNNH